MNRFKTYLLIPVLVFQISFLIPDLSWDSLHLTGYNGKPLQKISCDSSVHLNQHVNDIHPFSVNDHQFSGRAFAGKVMPLPDHAQKEMVENKETNFPADGDSSQKNFPSKKMVLINEIGAGNAKLF